MAESSRCEVLHCPICLDYYVDPRVLDCGHSYCLKCISGNSCSLCRRDHRYSSLRPPPRNFALGEVLSSLGPVLSDSPLSCVSCSRAAVMHCELCSYLCQSHFDQHQIGPFRGAHECVDVASCRKSPVRCVTHQRMLEYFCETCCLVCCRDCWEVDHEEHVVKLLSQAARKRKAELEGLRQPIALISSQLEETFSHARNDIAEKRRQIQELERNIVQIERQSSILLQRQQQLILCVETIQRLSNEPSDYIVMDDELLQPLFKLLATQQISIPSLKRSIKLHELQFRWGFGNYGSAFGQFRTPLGVALNNKGYIVVTDQNNHRVQVFDQRGNFIKIFGSKGSGESQLSNPYGVAVNKMNHIIVADQSNHRIQMFDECGNFLTTFGSLGSKDGEFHNPVGVAVDGDDKIIVADRSNHRIQVFNEWGDFQMSFGSHGSREGEFNNPVDVAVDSKGNIIVADHCNHRVQVFDREGNFSSSLHEKVQYPSGVAVDKEDKIVVTDQCNVKVFDRGQIVGAGNGQFSQPWGVVVDCGGNIFVADSLNHRIQVWKGSSEG